MTDTQRRDVFDGPPISFVDPKLATDHAEPRNSSDDGKRRDIQGLRMVAVVAVVVNHLTGHPRGGFVGVDVFFVISGYLITGLLVRDARPGVGPARFIIDFYKRRIRRLFPAALLTIAATIAVADALFAHSRYVAARTDGLWAAVFGANWRFAATGTDYFTANGPLSPFQHYWSLSVEEQFYVAWPVAVFVVAVASRTRSTVRGRQIAVGVAAGVLTAASLIIAFQQSTSDPTRAYFSTFTRGWELGLGALLACAVPYVRARTSVLTVMSWLGLTLIGVSLFVTHGDGTFPAPGALLPCLGSGLVIAAVSPSARARNFLLTCRPAVLIGDISYSVYLVHFPVIILLAAYMPHRGAYFYVAAAALTFGLSAMLYAAVEKPILDSRWLLPKRQTTQPRERGHGLRRGVLVGAVVAVAGFAAVALWPGEQALEDARYTQVNNTPAHTAAIADHAGPAQRALSNDIQAALTATAWPKLTPSIDAVLAGSTTPADVERCRSVNIGSIADCTFGSKHATHTAYIVGDSTSVTYDQAFIAMIAHVPGWKVRLAGAFGCSFTSQTMLEGDKGIEAKCPRHNTELVTEIRGAKPDLLIVTDIYQPRALRTGQPVSEAQWAATLRAEITKMQPVGKVVLLAPSPRAEQIAQCYTPTSKPIDCVGRPSTNWTTRYATESALAKTAGWNIVDSRPWFCNTSGFCPAFVGKYVVRHDGQHVTAGYATRIAPAMLEALRAVGAFR